ncbi:MAG: alpha/beta fold hydrolase [Thermonemataceae bacterium]
MKRFIGIVLILLWTTAASAQFNFDALEYPFEVKKIKIDQTEIAYVEEGKGKNTLLFVHGLGSYLPAWKKNISTLKEDYHCIAIDLPGYGKSDKNLEQFTLAQYAKYINQFIKLKKLKRVHLVGHSMGGQIAMTYAIKYPKTLKRLILLAPAGLEKFTEKEGATLTAYTQAKLVANTPDEQIKKNYERNYYDFPEYAQFMLDDRIRMKEAPAFPLFCKAFEQGVVAMLAEPVWQDLSKITMPTLIIFGKQDALIPNKYLHPTLTLEDVAASGKEAISNSEVHYVDKAGHMVQFEGAEEVNKIIQQFLKKK